MSNNQSFEQEVAKNIKDIGTDNELNRLSMDWIMASGRHHYTYNFRWLGRPLIQFPQDIVAMQELIWRIKPTLIIETGIAHGGSLILSASMLALLDYCDASANHLTIDPHASKRRVLGLDIDVRPHNRKALIEHPLAHMIEMIEGSSVAPEVVDQVRQRAAGHETVLVCLDSNHTHEHVLAELEAYAGLVSVGSYCVVSDTIVEDTPADFFPDRPWGPGNNPKTAVWEYLKSHPEFQIDSAIHHKLQITNAPDGYLQRVR